MNKKIKFGLIINNIDGRFQRNLLQGIKCFATENNITLKIFNGHSLNSPYSIDTLFNNVFELARTKSIDGLIISTGSLGTNSSDEILRSWVDKFSDFPIVTVGREIKGYSGILCDNKNGIIDGIKHLCAVHGKKRFAFIAGPKDSPESQERLEAYIEGLLLMGKDYNPQNVYYGDFSYRLCRKISEEILIGGFLPYDALICANDEMAWTIQSVLEEKGYFVPKDYSIIGFDNLLESAYQKPPLTTINQDLFNQTYQAGKTLLNIIKGDLSVHVDTIESRLIKRESCGCNFIDSLIFFDNSNESTDFETCLGSFIETLNLTGDYQFELRSMLYSLKNNLQLNLRTRNHTSLFLLSLYEWLEITKLWNNFSEIWLKSLEFLKREIAKTLSDQKDIIFLTDLFTQGLILVSQMADKKSIQYRQEQHSIQLRLRDFANNINSKISIDELLDSLREYSPELGVTSLILVLNESDHYNLYDVLKDVIISEKNTATMLTSVKELGNYLLDWNRDEDVIFTSLVAQDKFFGFIGLTVSDLDYQIAAGFQEQVSQSLLNISFIKQRDFMLGAQESLVDEYRLSEERYKDMIDMVPVIMWETDINFKMTYMNKKALEILDVKIGKSILDIVEKEDRNKLHNLQAHMKHKENIDFREIRIKKKDSTDRIILIQMNEIFNTKNEIIAIRWHALDPIPIVMENTLPKDDFLYKYNITTREAEILQYLFHGLKIKDIAIKISLAESTVKGHITKIYNKLGVDDRESLLQLVSKHKVNMEGYGSYLFKVFSQLIGSKYL